MAVGTFIGDAAAWSRNDPSARGPENYRVTYEGAVLQTFERNGYDDSDFMAIVWDEESGATKTVCYASTRGWTYANYATVDATPEVLAKAQAHAAATNLRLAIEADKAQARQIAVGREVVITPTSTGRDRRSKWAPDGVLPAGSTGFVAGFEVDSYRTPQYRYGGSVPPTYKYAVQYRGKMLWLAADAIEVANPEQYETPLAEIEASQPPVTAYTNFHRAVPGYLNMVAS